MSHTAGLDQPNEEGTDGSRSAEEPLERLMLRLHFAKHTVPVSVRIDREVLEWLKRKGAGHLERINDILAHVMKAERQRGTRRPQAFESQDRDFVP